MTLPNNFRGLDKSNWQASYQKESILEELLEGEEGKKVSKNLV